MLATAKHVTMEPSKMMRPLSCVGHVLPHGGHPAALDTIMASYMQNALPLEQAGKKVARLRHWLAQMLMKYRGSEG
jgi:hypothetical protein